MKKLRKLILMVVIASMITIPLVGCGAKANTSTTQQTKTSTSMKGNPPAKPPTGGGQGAGYGQGAKVTGTGVYTQSGKTVTKTNQTITTAKSNQSGVKVTNKGTLTLKNSTIKTSGKTTSEDSSNFYGLNAGVLAEAGSKINISNSKINTSGSGANGAFATGTGSVINLSNVTINTTADSSRGLDATLKGTVNATNVKISTKGTHCAALATDRGEGTINVTSGTMNTSGTDSPGIYSTGKITVSGAKITSTGSEAAVVEGRNSITLANTTISGAKKSGVMMYQSYSGDAEVGTSSFNMTGGSLAAAVGPLFYSTNTKATINLKNAKLTATSGTLLKASADRWGNSGKNGATVTFNSDSETLTGNIICDSISLISVSLKNNTTLNSAINNENKLANVSVTLDSSSKWNVTADSYVKTITDSDTTLANINSNGHNVYYDSSASANSWLNGKTVTLTGGGKLMPIK